MADLLNIVVTEDAPSKYRRSLRKNSSKKRKREKVVADFAENDADDKSECPSVFGLDYDDDQDIRTSKSLLKYTSGSVALISRKLHRPLPTISTILRYLVSVIVAYTENKPRVALRAIIAQCAVSYPDVKSYLEMRPACAQQGLPMHWLRNVEKFYNDTVPLENRVSVTSTRSMPWMKRKKSYMTLAEFILSQFDSDPASLDGIGECNLSDDDIHFCPEFTCPCNREKTCNVQQY